MTTAAELLLDTARRGELHHSMILHGPSRDELRALARRGLEETSGNYRLLTELFNMPAGDYKRFLNTLRKHNCHVAFQEFRTLPGRREGDSEKIA